MERVASDTFSLYGYGEIRTPIFEFTEVFQRGIGGETDVVKKEMYTFTDKGGRSLTLRPEGTAGVMRALSGEIAGGNGRRVYYVGPMFRGERPAAGRRRQFHQIGVEDAGSDSPAADAESVAMLARFLDSLGITGYRILLNTRGSSEDAVTASEILKKRLSDVESRLCGDCRDRATRNPWRVLDCKNPACQAVVDELPDITDSFSEESRARFDEVRRLLDAFGVRYEVAPRLVRGLDYYAHTVFEVVHAGLGAQDALAGGGRYEVPVPGVKKPVRGVGFAIGMERLVMALESLAVQTPSPLKPDIYIVSLGDDALMANFALAERFRSQGMSVVASMEAKSLKAQMRAANRVGASFAIIRGSDEIEREVLACRNMQSSEQCEIPEDNAVHFLKENLRNLSNAQA
jgi:histidyl-tRNA synthetase